jgi:hypothetical protein
LVVNEVVASIGVNGTSIRAGLLGPQNFVQGTGDISICSLLFELGRASGQGGKTCKEEVNPISFCVAKASDDVANFGCNGHRGRNRIVAEGDWYAEKKSGRSEQKKKKVADRSRKKVAERSRKKWRIRAEKMWRIRAEKMWRIRAEKIVGQSKKGVDRSTFATM